MRYSLVLPLLLQCLSATAFRRLAECKRPRLHRLPICSITNDEKCSSHEPPINGVSLKKLACSSIAAFTLLFGGPTQHAIASDGKILNEAWKTVNDYYFDNSYNGNDWSRVQKEYMDKVLSGGDETDMIKKMLGILLFVL